MRKLLSLILFIAIALSTAFIAGCGPDSSDYIPKDDLPEGITFIESADTTDCDSLSGTIGENTVSFSQAVYSQSEPGDAYVLVMECEGEEAAEVMLKYLDAEVLDSSVYVKNISEVNGNKAIEASISSSSPPEYVLLWQEDNFVFMVLGNSRDSSFNLASSIK
jgi:hypothetical protein